MSVFLLLFVRLASSSPAQAPDNGVLRGALLSESGDPLANARIWILELGRSERTASDGSFAFEAVPPGIYQVLAETDIRAVATRETTIAAGGTTELALVAELDLLRVNEIVSVTGRADELIGVSDSARRESSGDETWRRGRFSDPAISWRRSPGWSRPSTAEAGRPISIFCEGSISTTARISASPSTAFR